MRLSPCACSAEHYARAPRTWWMKLLATRRLYHCYACDCLLFLPPGKVQQKRRARQRQAAAAAPAKLRAS